MRIGGHRESKKRNLNRMWEARRKGEAEHVNRDSKTPELKAVVAAGNERKRISAAKERGQVLEWGA